MQMILEQGEVIFPSLEMKDEVVKNLDLLRNYYVTLTCLLDIIGFTCKNPFTAVYESEHTEAKPKFWKTTYPAFKVGDTAAGNCLELDLLNRILESFADMGFGNHSVALFNRMVELFQRNELSAGVSANYVGIFRPRAISYLAKHYSQDFTLLFGNRLLIAETHASIALELSKLVQVEPRDYVDQGKSYVFPLCKHGLTMRLVKDGKRAVMMFKCHLASEAGANCFATQDKV